MTANKVVRVIDAADNETIRIRWWRARLTDSDPPVRVTEILDQEYTVPPSPVWEARLHATKDDPTHG